MIINSMKLRENNNKYPILLLPLEIYGIIERIRNDCTAYLQDATKREYPCVYYLKEHMLQTCVC